MIELGYPHRPRRLDILDRPPEQQYWGVPRYDQSRPAIFDWGEVRYFHASGEQVGGVAGLQQELYDCVFLGQAIEHIRPEALPGMLAWIRRHLTPNGRLIFDTPNRLLTKIQCPNSYIDPDHKREYAPTELQEVLEANGFVVSVRTGMVHLPVQALSGRFDKREFVGAEQLSEDVDRCYLFAFEATSSTT